MNKTTTIFIIAVILIAATVIICVTPRFTKVDVTLNATKMDLEGNALGTYEISIHGRKEDYLNGKSALDVNIVPFDDLKSFQGSTGGSISPMPGSDYCYTIFSAFRDNMELPDYLTLYFSSDMDRWLLTNNTGNIFYVGSASGSYTTEGLLEYFQGAIPSNWKSN